MKGNTVATRISLLRIEETLVKVLAEADELPVSLFPPREDRLTLEVWWDATDAFVLLLRRLVAQPRDGEEGR